MSQVKMFIGCLDDELDYDEKYIKFLEWLILGKMDLEFDFFQVGCRAILFHDGGLSRSEIKDSRELALKSLLKSLEEYQ